MPTPPTRRKTFLIGAGCQKGGTTWLHHHLARSRQFARGYRKEYHVFDALDLPSEAWMRNRILLLAERALAAGRAGEPIDAEMLHRVSMYADPTLYYDYFAGLLRARPRFRLTADMTPDYGMLPATRFTEVRDQMTHRGIRTASVLVMRDPVERTFSHLRMKMDRAPGQFPYTALEALERHFAEDSYVRRSRYEETLATLESVFAPEDLFITFYERLFDAGELARLAALLGIDPVEPDLGTRRNSSTAPTTPLPASLARQVAELHRPAYEAVAARFPEVDLSRLWPHSVHVLGG